MAHPRFLSRAVFLLMLACSAHAALAFTTVHEGFEEFEPGVEVSSFELGDVTVSLDRPEGSPFRAYQYGLAPMVFEGDSEAPNPAPNVRGLSPRGFITTSAPRDRRGFNRHQPLVFDLSKPVRGVQMTVVDLLESYGSVTLTGYNEFGEIVSESSLSGPPEEDRPSTVRLKVASAAEDIVRAVLTGGVAGKSDYAIDDFVLNLARACSRADLTTSAARPGDAAYGIADGAVDSSDMVYFMVGWNARDPKIADFTTTGAPEGLKGHGRRDGRVDGADLYYFLALWLPGCD